MSYYIYLLEGNKWNVIRYTEYLQVAIDICQRYRANAYKCNVEDETGKHLFGDK